MHINKEFILLQLRRIRFLAMFLVAVVDTDKEREKHEVPRR